MLGQGLSIVADRKFTKSNLAFFSNVCFNIKRAFEFSWVITFILACLILSEVLAFADFGKGILGVT